MKNPIRFVIVGTGEIANSYLKAFQQSERCDLVAAVDINHVAVAQMAEASDDIRTFLSVDDLLDSDTVFEAALVCTPPSTHREISEKLLAEGVHTLCETPLSSKFTDAMEMAIAADKAGCLFTMAAPYRFAKEVNSAFKLLEKGSIGDLVLFENAFTGIADMSQRWNSDAEISGGGVLIDRGTHALDLARFFLGPIEELQVIEGLSTQQLAVEETVAVHVKSEDGVVGNIDLSWSIDKNDAPYLSLFGTEGTIQLGKHESKWKAQDGKWQVFGGQLDLVAAQKAQLENFAAAICGDETLLATAEDGLASILAVEAAYSSLQREPWDAHRSRNRWQQSDRIEIDASTEELYTVELPG